MRIGSRLRALRVQRRLTQAALAERLKISASYLNLIEHERRPVPAPLLERLASTFDLELGALVGGGEGKLLADLEEAFADPLFEEERVAGVELRALVDEHPDLARAVARLHQAYANVRGVASSVSDRLLDGAELGGLGAVRLSSEQVSDLFEEAGNHFAELESEAEALRAEGGFETETLFDGLARHLKSRHEVTVRIRTVEQMRGAVRRYDPERRQLDVSEVLRRGSRNFQLASQVGLLRCDGLLDRLTAVRTLTTPESRALGRVALAGYFAGAVLMPYRLFLKTAESLRYDIELLEHRFRVSFEQVCHRLTTLRRPGEEGVAFYLVRVDLAGNISKKFGSAGIRFPRFSGLCPLWNVHGAFLQPGRVRTQLSRLPDGSAVFAVARTVSGQAGGYHAPQVLHAIGIGCDVRSARRLVYADGVDLADLGAGVPIGITCRSCERLHCQARAFPALDRPLRIDENVRGPSFYAPATDAS